MEEMESATAEGKIVAIEKRERTWQMPDNGVS